MITGCSGWRWYGQCWNRWGLLCVGLLWQCHSGLVWTFEDGQHICMHVFYSLSTRAYLYCGAAAWPLNSLHSLYAKYSILTPQSNTEKIFSHYYSISLWWTLACVDVLLNCIHLTDAGARRLQLDCLTSHKCNNTWMNFCLCCLSVSPLPTPTPPLICVRGKEKKITAQWCRRSGDKLEAVKYN